MRGRRRLGAKVVGSMGCDARSSSLQRMALRSLELKSSPP